MIGQAARMIMKARGRQCRAFRKYLGCSQKEVAIDVGVKEWKVSHFENGRIDDKSIYQWYVNKNMLKYDKSLYMRSYNE